MLRPRALRPSWRTRCWAVLGPFVAGLAAAQTTAPVDPAEPDRPGTPALAADPATAPPLGFNALIAVDPLNPRLDPDEPWVIGPGGQPIPQRRQFRPLPPVFKAPLGEAFSVRRNEAAIELTFGERPALGGTLGMRVNRLEVEPAVVNLTVGEAFTLDELSVKAYAAPGELVERAPLRLEIEGPEEIVDRAAFERDGRTLSALNRGVGRIWVTSLLPSRLTEPFSTPVILIVRAPDSPGARLSSRIYENTPAAP